MRRAMEEKVDGARRRARGRGDPGRLVVDRPHHARRPREAARGRLRAAGAARRRARRRSCSCSRRRSAARTAARPRRGSRTSSARRRAARSAGARAAASRSSSSRRSRNAVARAVRSRDAAILIATCLAALVAASLSSGGAARSAATVRACAQLELKSPALRHSLRAATIFCLRPSSIRVHATYTWTTCPGTPVEETCRRERTSSCSARRAPTSTRSTPGAARTIRVSASSRSRGRAHSPVNPTPSPGRTGTSCSRSTRRRSLFATRQRPMQPVAAGSGSARRFIPACVDRSARTRRCGSASRTRAALPGCRSVRRRPVVLGRARSCPSRPCGALRRPSRAPAP